MTNKQHALIVGDGWVANARHKPALARLNITFDVYDIASGNQTRLHGNDYSFVIICTPPQARLEAFKAVIKLGVNRVYFEKPLAHSLDDAEAILNLVRKNKIDARSCHNFIFAQVGQAILSDVQFNDVVFYQLNRPDRNLPKWVEKLPYGIGLDEFPHMGYLSQAIFPDDGMLSSGLHYIENKNSPINKWSISYTSQRGYVYCDLWRDAVYVNKSQAQSAYWQYKEEWGECKQRLSSLFAKIKSKLVSKQGYDFGTNLMWEKFVYSSLTEKESELTSIELSVKILRNYFSLKDSDAKP